jgi:DNA polymerase
VPRTRSLRVLAREAAGCTACHLYRDATQTVFGEGDRAARLVLVGEQPGDREDIAGHPFVGPAGHVLDRALAAAGIARDEVWLTNAVKHFKFRRSGKRRLHDRPDRGEIEVCKPWLFAELALLQPACVVALGAVAATSLFGKAVPIASNRGVVRELAGGPTVVTYHPSALLRVDDRELAKQRFEELVADLQLAHATSRAPSRAAKRA